MIQNLENKMELQINSLETKIEKIQEMFNKDLEEIKKSQLKMNNAINGIKDTLEGTMSRIMEKEDRISEVEDKMMEINEAERKKEKRIKRNEDNLRDLWDNVKHPNIRIIGVQKKKTKRKDHEKILKEIIAENFPKNGEGNSHTASRNPESPKQDKPKATHPKTHINQINKDQTQRKNIKSSKGETTNNTQRGSYEDNS